MYEHAYHLDFGANATAYIDAFMRNIDWAAVAERMAAVRADRPLPREDPSDQSLPSLSVEELAAQLAQGEPVQVLDARPRHYISRATDMMEGAIWRDPERVEEWIGELSPDRPVAVYCAYGFHVGCNVTRALRERGLDARYVRGGRLRLVRGRGAAGHAAGRPREVIIGWQAERAPPFSGLDLRGGLLLPEAGSARSAGGRVDARSSA